MYISGNWKMFSLHAHRTSLISRCVQNSYLVTENFKHSTCMKWTNQLDCTQYQCHWHNKQTQVVVGGKKTLVGGKQEIWVSELPWRFYDDFQKTCFKCYKKGHVTVNCGKLCRHCSLQIYHDAGCSRKEGEELKLLINIKHRMGAVKLFVQMLLSPVGQSHWSQKLWKEKMMGNGLTLLNKLSPDIISWDQFTQENSDKSLWVNKNKTKFPCVFSTNLWDGSHNSMCLHEMG